MKAGGEEEREQTDLRIVKFFSVVLTALRSTCSTVINGYGKGIQY